MQLKTVVTFPNTHFKWQHTHKSAQKHKRVPCFPFLRPFVCVSQCVSCLCCSAVLYCLFSSFWVSGAPCWSVLPLLSCLLVTFSAVQRGTAVHTHIPLNYFTMTSWLPLSPTLSSSYRSLSFSLSRSHHNVRNISLLSTFTYRS